MKDSYFILKHSYLLGKTHNTKNAKNHSISSFGQIYGYYPNLYIDKLIITNALISLKILQFIVVQ